MLLEYELRSSQKPYMNKDVWVKPVSVLRDISMNLRMQDLDKDEIDASKYMCLRLVNSLMGYLKDLPHA